MNSRWILFLLFLIIGGCDSQSDRLKSQIQSETQQVEKKLSSLEGALSGGSLMNAMLINEYANKLSSLQPENRTLIENLAKNASPTGPMLQTLQTRFSDVKSAPAQSVEQLSRNLDELLALGEAAHLATFNDALSDTVNVLADLSQGALPRVQAISQSAEQSTNKTGIHGAGSQLIGNPQYGQWVTGSNGMSFWEWYGMYALFSNLMGGNRYYYSDWAGRRPYSYYHDYGRNRYTKPSTYRKQQTLQTKTEKNFRQQGKRFSSPYAKQRTGATQLSKTSKSRPSSGSFRKSSSYRSSASSSNRRGSSRTSRGPRRGK